MKHKPSGPRGSALEYAQLRPDQRLARCQALVLGLEADALTGRRTPAFDQLLATADGDMLNMVLAAAMKHDFPRSAVAAAETLGKRGDLTMLYAVSPTPARRSPTRWFSRIAAYDSPPSRQL